VAGPERRGAGEGDEAHVVKLARESDSQPFSTIGG
jgi:hypothetical protein